MSKFFVNQNQINNNKIKIIKTDFIHITKVLRCKEGEKLVVCDNVGFDYHCVIEKINIDSINLKIIEKTDINSEPTINITLFQALPKLDKMELVIQKCVELGVTSIVPMLTDRTIIKLNNAQKEEKKITRFNKISESAAKQSGRGIIPIVYNFKSFNECINHSKNLDCSIIPYEKENDNGLKNVIYGFNGSSIGIFIGPEGGFSEHEITFAKQNNVIPVTLGNRILRTETAGLYTVSVIIYELGNIRKE